MSRKEVGISFIIPVYNAQKWIDSCLKPFGGSEASDVEVIVVDDGSTDKSCELCDSWAKKNSCIRVIHKENGGVSSARNVGIRNACGKYVMFIDSDDYIMKEALQVLLETCRHDYDLVQFGFHKVGSHDEVLGSHIFNSIDFDKERIISNIIIDSGKNGRIGSFFRAVWGKLFKRSIIRDHDITFPEDLYIGEDAVFLLKYVEYINNFKVIDRIVYNYRITDSSAVNRYKRDLYFQSDLEASMIRELIRPYAGSRIIQESYSCYAWWMYFRLVGNAGRGGRESAEGSPDYKKWREKYGSVMRQPGEKLLLKEKYGVKYSIAKRVPAVFELAAALKGKIKRQ